jgi:hypothetical protein
MIVGHFGLAAAVKSRERQVPLWVLMLATVWLDVLFVPLVAVGIERFDPVPSTGGGYGNVIIHADYTHSLVGAVVIAALFGIVAAVPWGRRTGAVLGIVVFSHWLLDLVLHRADMPILPGGIGGLPRVGLGLWQVPAASAAVELAWSSPVRTFIGVLRFRRRKPLETLGSARPTWSEACCLRQASPPWPSTSAARPTRRQWARLHHAQGVHVDPLLGDLALGEAVDLGHRQRCPLLRWGYPTTRPYVYRVR